MLQAVSKKERSDGDIERLRARAVRFIREEVHDGAHFETAMAALARMLKEEEEQLEKRSETR